MNTYAETIEPWQTLGQPPPLTLRDARDQLHWAAQVVASVGYTLVEPAPDWSHLSLAWMDAFGALASQPASNTPRFRAALRLADLTLVLLDQADSVHSHYSLIGRTLDEGYAWLASAIAALTDAETPPSLVRPDHEMPTHPTGNGAPFSLDTPEAFTEMARWYANADSVLQTLSALSPQKPPLLTWPHHFDSAIVFEVDLDKDPEERHSIGVGMVPGDEYYAEPYWYITPGPYPEDADLPPLEGEGFWRTEGWFGAILTGSTLVAAGGAEEQARRVQAFIRSVLQPPMNTATAD